MLTVLALVAGVALGTFVAAPGVVDSRVRSRLGQLQARTGRTITVGEVDIGLHRGVRLVGLRVGAPEGGAGAIAASEVATDLSLLDLVEGRRRPERVVVSELSLQLRLDSSGLTGFDDLLAALGAGGGAVGATSPSRSSVPAPVIEVDVRRGRATIDLAVPGLPFDAATLSDLEGTIAGAPGGRGFTVRGRARLALGEHEWGVRLTLRSGSDPVVSVGFDAPIAVPLAFGGHQATARFAGVERAPEKGITRLSDVVLESRGARVEVAELLVADRAGGWSMAPADVQGLELRGIRVTREGLTLSAERIAFDRAGPGPPQVRAWGIEVREAPEPWRLAAGARVRALEITLAGDAIERFASDPSAAIASVAVVGPSVKVPSRWLGDAAVALGVPDIERAIADWKARRAAYAAAVAAEEARHAEAIEEWKKAKKKAKKWDREVPKKPRRRRVTMPGEDGDETAGSSTGSEGVVPVDQLRSALRRLEAALPLGWMRRAAEVDVSVSDGVVATTVEETGAALRLEGLAVVVNQLPAPGGGRSAGLAPEASAKVFLDEREVGRFEAALEVDPSGSVRRLRALLGGWYPTHLARKVTKHFVATDTSDIELQVDYRPPVDWDSGTFELAGRVAVRDVGIDYWRISDAPVTGITGSAEFALKVATDGSSLRLDLPRIQSGRALLKASAAVERRDERGYRYDLRLALPRQDCAVAFGAIPPSLIPNLEGLEVEGEMDFRIRLKGRTTLPDKLRLRVEGDVDQCHAITLGEHIDILPLKDGTFVHHPLDPKRGRLSKVEVGPASPGWVQSRNLPGHLKSGAVVSEDMKFRKHGGINWFLIQRALRINFARGRFVYGGSSITQQLIKNVYLHHGKALARKLEEAIIAWQMERDLTKDEILTLYLNMIQYGPGIYGINKAAAVYFGVGPGRLTPLQSAFIMSLKPDPLFGYAQFAARRLSPFWVARVKYILTVVYRREGGMSGSYYRNAAPYQPWQRR